MFFMTATVDITREVCPMTYVRVKLALEKVPRGELLEVLLKGAEPRKNVPQSALEEGHHILAIDEQSDGSTRLLLKRGM